MKKEPILFSTKNQQHKHNQNFWICSIFLLPALSHLISVLLELFCCVFSVQTSLRKECVCCFSEPTSWDHAVVLDSYKYCIGISERMTCDMVCTLYLTTLALAWFFSSSEVVSSFVVHIVVRRGIVKLMLCLWQGLIDGVNVICVTCPKLNFWVQVSFVSFNFSTKYCKYRVLGWYPSDNLCFDPAFSRNLRQSATLFSPGALPGKEKHVRWIRSERLKFILCVMHSSLT